MQFNCHKLINDFYNNEVRLKEEIKHLRKLKKTNLDRLSSGLLHFGHPNFAKDLEQGSIAMHTANKAPDNDYDIDIAVIFEKDDLPTTPLAARKRVAEALIEKATNFTKEPEARTNAVTIWYADGYHVDFAVYRRSTDFWGREVLEHAGSEWSERDPTEITNWFTEQVKSKSPSKDDFITPSVENGQMRRVVRWIKRLTKGRDGWNLPGGLIISALVSECYVSDRHRDDESLYKTIVAIKERLDMYCDVYNPTNSSLKLTEKSKFLTQVKNLKKRLPSVIKRLDKLFESDCNEEKAKKYWNYMFQHEFFTKEESNRSSVLSKSVDLQNVDIRVSTYRSKEGKLTSFNVPESKILPKHIHLKFEVRVNIPSPYEIRWVVENSGEEAETSSDMGHSYTTNELIQWERTSYRGKHFMTCEVLRNGRVVASAKREVNIR